MAKYTIKTATAEYTGGGIYIYYGELNENGLYFRTADEWEHIAICDADASGEDADYPEFYEDHEIGVLHDYEYENFFINMIDWIVQNTPDGNYNVSELEKRTWMRLETTIEIEDAQVLADKIKEETMQAKFDSMMKWQIDSIKGCMAEYRDGCNFIFADSTQYRRDFEKVWQDEFYYNAVRLFENNGYRIEKRGSHTYITW